MVRRCCAEWRRPSSCHRITPSCSGSRGFNPPGDTEQLFPLHQCMPQRNQRLHGPAGQPEWGAVIPRCPHPYNEPGAFRLGLLQNEGPGHNRLARRGWPAENEISFRLEGQQYKAFGDAGLGGIDSPHLNPLELGDNTLCAWMPVVIDLIVAVPAGTPAAHLSEPGPDLRAGARIVTAWVSIPEGRVMKPSPEEPASAHRDWGVPIDTSSGTSFLTTSHSPVSSLRSVDARRLVNVPLIRSLDSFPSNTVWARQSQSGSQYGAIVPRTRPPSTSTTVMSRMVQGFGSFLFSSRP